jgi:hypothetical protein
VVLILVLTLLVISIFQLVATKLGVISVIFIDVGVVIMLLVVSLLSQLLVLLSILMLLSIYILACVALVLPLH